jgi:hypothetical protein
MFARPAFVALSWISLFQALGACSGAQTDAADGEKRVAITVVPNALPGVSDVCYSLTVSNAAGEVLWTRDDVCSSRFGTAAGDVSYVGPCDPNSNPNKVDLVLANLTGTNDTLDFANPCPPGAPCSKTVQCQQRATTPVDFQLAVTIFDPNQGFVGIGVDLDAVFCSARLDCAADSGTDPLLILRDPVTGARVPTVVLNTACFRADGEPLFLYGSDVTVQCDVGAATFDPALGPGNQFATVLTPPGFFAASTYDAPGGNPAWQSFALALALKPSATSCRLTAAFSPLVSAAAVAVPGGFAIPPQSPVIAFDVGLTDAAGTLSCTHHTLNVGGSGVSASLAGGGRTLANQIGSGNGCDLVTDGSGTTITCTGASATIDGACTLTPHEEIVSCNGVRAALGLGHDGAFRALAELQSRLLAFHQANGAFPVGIAAETPQADCCAAGGVRECEPRPETWDVPAWNQLDFSIDTPVDFVLSIVGIDSHNVSVIAKTDVYCDATTTQLVVTCSDTGGVPTCTLRVPPRQEAGGCQLASDSDGTTITCSGNFASINNSCFMSSTSGGTTVSCGGASFTLPPGFEPGFLRLADLQAGLMSHVHQHFFNLEGTVGPSPFAACCGAIQTECPVSPGAWETPLWQALGFAIDTPTQFVYEYGRVGDNDATAIARGDVDCDTITFEYTLRCSDPSSSTEPMTCTLRVPSPQRD